MSPTSFHDFWMTLNGNMVNFYEGGRSTCNNFLLNTCKIVKLAVIINNY